MKTQWLRVLAIVIFLLMIIFGMLLTPVHSDDPPQLAFTFDHRDEGGRDIVVIKKVTIVLALTPVKRYAPLTKNDYMICTPVVVPIAFRKLNGEDIGIRNDIAFRCGEKLYVMTTLNIIPEK